MKMLPSLLLTTLFLTSPSHATAYSIWVKSIYQKANINLRYLEGKGDAQSWETHESEVRQAFARSGRSKVNIHHIHLQGPSRFRVTDSVGKVTLLFCKTQCYINRK